MYYVYILKEIDKNHYYTGSTKNLRRRLKEHYNNSNISTRGRKWKLYCYFAFEKEILSKNFEKYLKSGSGRAFSKKHFEFKIDKI